MFSDILQQSSRSFRAFEWECNIRSPTIITCFQHSSTHQVVSWCLTRLKMINYHLSIPFFPYFSFPLFGIAKQGKHTLVIFALHNWKKKKIGDVVVSGNYMGICTVMTAVCVDWCAKTKCGECLILLWYKFQNTRSQWLHSRTKLLTILGCTRPVSGVIYPL